MTPRRVLAVPLTALAAWLALVTGYLVLLTASAIVGRRRRVAPRQGPAHRFAVLIPAHNEEQLIGRLLGSLQQQVFPAACFDVYVVADNCEDATAALARAGGAQVYERVNPTQRAKGFALQWLLEQLRAGGLTERYDAFVVLDADSVVDSTFLHCMDAHLSAGSQVVQAYYTVLNVDESPVTALRYVALAALHYVRPLGRATLGLSCGLKGNGMCFARPVIDQFGWDWFSLAEDVEFHLQLVRAGIRVDFAGETAVRADMPINFAQAASQNARWERGRLAMAQGHAAALLVDGVRRRSAMRVDAAFEQFIPPLSVPFALGCLCLVGGLVLRTRRTSRLVAAALAGQLAHLLVGLALVHAPPSAYRQLVFAPAYVAWKVSLYGRALLQPRSDGWVRTSRLPGRAAEHEE